MDFKIGKIRNMIMLLAPAADFEANYTFYYDETNNIKKFYVRENDFNNTFVANFILGGLVYEGVAPDVQKLIEDFNLQKSIKEIKFKHIAKGEFLDCLDSQRLSTFLQFIKDSNLYVHYSSLNILYWAIVDIVDSAIANSEAALKLGLPFANHLKNDLYKLSRLEIESVIDLLYRFEYPNIKRDKIIPFIESLTSLFDQYIDTQEFHFGLESLRQILKEARKKGDLPFIVDEQDFILLQNLSQFYLRPIYLFKNSSHIFDKEDFIEDILNDYRVLDNGIELKNYSFIDSESHQLIQLSDIFVGIMGKLSKYLNTNTRDKLNNDLNNLTVLQKLNVDLLMDVIDKSHNKNYGFIHSVDSIEEMSKMNIIRMKRH